MIPAHQNNIHAAFSTNMYFTADIVPINTFTPIVAIWVQLSQSFEIFGIRALWRSGLSVRVLSVRVPGC